MESTRSARAWFPAGLVVLTTGLGLLVGRAVTTAVGPQRAAYDDLLRQLVFRYNGVGHGWSTRTLPESLLGYLLALLVVGGLAYLVARGTHPRSSPAPVFLGLWGAVLVAMPLTALPLAVRLLVDSGYRIGSQSFFPLLAEGLGSGMKWGWLPALVGTVAWVATRRSWAPPREATHA